MKIVEYISIPCKSPSSYAFCGETMDVLAVTTASKDLGLTADENDGFTLLLQIETRGRKPFIFGKKYN